MNKKRIISILIAVVMLVSFASALPFTDVPEDHEYREAIEFSYEKGFVFGVTPTAYMPNLNLTRAHLVTVWARSLQLNVENHNFTDITGLRNYYDTPVIVLRSKGIIDGVSPNSFAPHANITREQLALITMRTYNLGVENEEEYMRYQDHAQISEWARDGVSSCLNAGVFIGLYNNDDFNPQKPVTRAEICKLIYNISLPMYDVNIAALEGGTITAYPIKARPGTLITLTVSPNEGKQLKAGTLKYNDVAISEDTFVMPAADVLVTAEFEDEEVQEEAVLEEIEITNQPDKTTYTTGEELDLAGLTVTAKYSDDTSKVITDYTTAPEDGSTLETAGTITITVSYTEGDLTKEATFDVEVTDEQ